ncbi:MAG: hypothetical protein HYU64_00175 [Armatimonadetes bacterium]|nr:hypothetical protein [Armatimonadota bacterium]
MPKAARVLLVLVLSSLLCPALRADQDIPLSRLSSLGVVLQRCMLNVLSPDGGLLLVQQKTSDTGRIRKGLVYDLLAFRFKDGKLLRVDRIPLPMREYEQIALADSGKEALIMGHRGALLVLADLEKKTARVVWKHTKGVPGFRCEGLMWFRDGRYYAVGYSYDERAVALGDDMVVIDPHQSGPGMFRKVMDVGKLMTSIPGPVSLRVFDSPDAVYYIYWDPKARKTRLEAYWNGKKTPLNEADLIPTFACHGGRVLHDTRSLEKKTIETLIQDVPTGKKWVLAKGIPYTYYFVSEKVATGTLRLSPNGTAYAFMNPRGIHWGQIPPR